MRGGTLRGIHGPIPLQASPRKISVLLLSGFFLSTACLASNHVTGNPASPTHSQSRRSGELTSRWERGVCRFSNLTNSITYTNSVSQATLRLDVPSSTRPTSLLCSSDYTVLLRANRAIIAIGAEDALSGHESLGLVGDLFTFANSYEVNLAPIFEHGGGVSGQRLSGEVLTIIATNGQKWELNLSNPHDGWSIY